MSDAVVSNGESSIAIDPVSPAAAPAPKPTGTAEDKPAWLDARLEQARRAALKEAGFESIEDAKKAAEERNNQREAKKSEAQKRAEAEAALQAEQAKAREMSEALGVYAKSQLDALTEAQRSAVVAVAGDDPAKQLKTITALRPTWASAVAPATPAPEKPRDTAPAPSAPKDLGSTSSPPDMKAIHAELKKTNPILAARYALANGLFENT